MFEQSLVVSQVGRVSAGARWTWAGSVTLQCCAAAALIVVPMLSPERLALRVSSPRSHVPLLPVKVAEIKVERMEAASSAESHVAMTAPARGCDDDAGEDSTWDRRRGSAAVQRDGPDWRNGVGSTGGDCECCSRSGRSGGGAGECAWTCAGGSGDADDADPAGVSADLPGQRMWRVWWWWRR